jgi:hypothetical protein
MKITNFKFQNQTIEKIEVDCENVVNVEIKLTKTKFNIVIVKEGKSIKKEIKKKNIHEVVDLVIEELEEVVEPVFETVVVPVVELFLEKNDGKIEEVFQPVVEPVVTLVLEKNKE